MSKEPYVRSRSNDFTLEQPVEPTCPECGQLLHTDWKQFAHNYLQDTLLDPRLELGLAICKKCGQGTPADLQPERQVSRDFDTIEHEPEMPLRTNCMHHAVCKYPEGDGLCPTECGHYAEWLDSPAHDTEIASKAVKDAKEALECAEYAFLHPASNQEFALNAVQQALAHIRAMAEE